METAEEIYSEILTSVSRHLHMVNPNLAAASYRVFEKKLEKYGVVYTNDPQGIRITHLPPESKKIMYNAIISFVAPFEDKYGINETWVGLRTDVINILTCIRQPLRLLDIEVPISAYTMMYAFFENLIAVNASGFRKIKWYDGVVTVTNHRLLFQDKESLNEIPLQTIATIGREIYLVYTGTTAKGIIKAIDFKDDTKVSMSCALVLAKQEAMRDFVNTSRVMRAEHRRLSMAETRVVVALYNEAMLKELGQVCKVGPSQAKEAYDRLLKLKYIDERGHLTSYGINAAIEVLEHEKLTKADKYEVGKDETGFRGRISREL